MLRASSFAKINLGLRVLGTRADGYHEVRTVLQSVDLADDLLFETAPELSLETRGRHDVPAGEANLVLRAARALAARHPRRGARIVLDKRIPPGAGLGGGSGNAAVTLMALDRLWETACDPGLLDSLARELGADVPFFLYGGTCLGLGKGDEIAPMPDIPPWDVVVLWPGRPLSTRAVYEGLPLPLTRPRILSSMKGFLPGSPPRESLEPGAPPPLPIPDVENDLEETAFSLFPGLAGLKDRLLGAGASAAALTGSGSAVFGLFTPSGGLEAKAASLGAAAAQALACRTLGREAYRRRLFERSRT
ncbi:MAG TPA: 4-(cytidine 5'-diphospho)-2-C-methyl-D-erythritol kinase [Candidatus Polarisedimenticolia bacterium]|nr:4-(cytidine 5'-diphospho)-2-C-methyl-D-erythritol kinase [Candidatus Polarisedimenticolia bacterium]